MWACALAFRRARLTLCRAEELDGEGVSEDGDSIVGRPALSEARKHGIQHLPLESVDQLEDDHELRSA